MFAVRVVQPSVNHVVRVALVLDGLVPATRAVNVPVDMVHSVVLLVAFHWSSPIN